MTTEARGSSSARVIRNRDATVASRPAAGQFVAYQVAETAQNPKPSFEEVEVERATGLARSMSLLINRGGTSMSGKNDDQKKLLSDQQWFNLVVGHLSDVGLCFPRDEVHKPNGAGYRLVLELSRLLNHLDGHHDKVKATNSSLPVSQVSKNKYICGPDG